MPVTYIVGLKRGADTAIIADSAITRSDRAIEMSALKTGKLFPGCMYGLAGHAEAARQFVIDCKIALTGSNTLEGFWSEFEQFIARYEYPLGRDFHAILASRSSGRSLLFTFSPMMGLREEGDAVTIGSGKGALDEALVAFLTDVGDAMTTRLSGEGYPAGFAVGAVTSLWLTQRSQGDEYSQLESLGVGGVFHFNVQTPDTESRQPPGMFVLARRDASSGISYWIYRVAFVGATLVIHNGATQRVQASLDAAAWPKADQFSKEERRDYFDEIWRQLDEQPAYYFWGLGVADTEARHALFFCVDKGGEVSLDGTLGPLAREVLQRTLPLNGDGADIPEKWLDRVVFATGLPRGNRRT